MIKKQLQKTVRKLVDLSFKEGRMSEIQVTRSVKLLKALPKSEAVQALVEYLKNLKRKEREHTMYIETIVPLSPTQIKRMKKIVEKKAMPTGPPAGRTDRQVKITRVLIKINPEILGGIKLRVGDEILDESILGKINQVKEAIAYGRSGQSN